MRAYASVRPCHVDELGLVAIDGLGAYLLYGLLGRCLELGQRRVGLHVTEIMVDGGDHLVGIEVARKTDGHVVGNVVGGVVVLDVGDRGVLQMVLISQHAVAAARVVGVEHRQYTVIGLLVISRERHVVLLIYGLQLGVEAADNGILETLALDLGPVLDLVRGYVLGVDRLVERSPCV